MDRKFRYAYGFLILLMLWIAVSSHAEQSVDQIELSLQQCISLALESNLNIRIQRISPNIKGALVTMAKGVFDPSVTLGPTVSRAEEPSSTSLSGADVRITNSSGFTLGINDPIITGGRYGLSFDSNRTESNSSFQTLNPAYRSSLSLTISQPLLEGFGLAVNKASITIARNNQVVE